jgi:uncharacterized membrane protein YdjX (TVP38/TMEM64 family)
LDRPLASPGASTGTESSNKGPRLAKLFAAAALVAALVALWALLPLSRWSVQFAEWIQTLGRAGIGVFVLGYIGLTLLFAPGSILTLIAGFVWGPVLGTLVVWPTATVAAALAFLVGRFVARGWVERKIEGNERFEAIDRAVAKNGFRIVFLLRLSPIFPYNLLNYALGLTKVSLPSYMLASLLGMLPGTAAYVYLGSLVTTASRLAEGVDRQSPVQTVLYWAGLVATVLVTILVTRYARAELKKSLADVPSQAGAQGGTGEK